METPERIYFGEADKSVLDIYATKEHDDEVEYVRKDVFIEKACEWLDFCLKDRPKEDIKFWLEDFKKYMEDKL